MPKRTVNPQPEIPYDVTVEEVAVATQQQPVAVVTSARDILVEEIFATEGGWQSEQLRRKNAEFIADTILPRLAERGINLVDNRK